MDVVLEVGQKRVFASALDWPGWCRVGRDEGSAVDTLLAYAPRYEVVTTRAGLKLPTRLDVEVVERLKGSAGTDFGAPMEVSSLEHGALPPQHVKLLQACWAVFDDVVREAPAELRKGPRGGGRDRDKIVEHVLGAENAYARKIGVRFKQPPIDEPVAIGEGREAIVDGLRHPPPTPPNARPWPPRYMVRRMAWHVLDHSWEIQDRAQP